MMPCGPRAAISLAAAFAMSTIAQTSGEPVNSIWLVVFAVCTYLIGYRFYGAFLAAKALTLDNARATPAERLRDGHDFERYLDCTVRLQLRINSHQAIEFAGLKVGLTARIAATAFLDESSKQGLLGALADLPDDLVLQRLAKQPIDAQCGDGGAGPFGIAKWLYDRHHNWP